MGNTPSYHKQQYAARDATENGHDDRPSKRRRLDATPVTQPKPKDPTLADQLFLAHEIGTVQRALRVQVQQITHKDASKIRVSDPLSETVHAPRQVLETKARCKLTLSHISRAGESVLHCQSQLCTLKTFELNATPYENVRVWLPRPFHIPEDSVFVNRDDDGRFHLADAYKVTVDLEAAGQGAWPPLSPDHLVGYAMQPRERLATPRWVLTGELTHVFGKEARSMVPLLLKTAELKTQPTKYLFDIDARWTTGYEASAIRPLEKDVEPSITVFPDGPPLSPVYTTRTPTRKRADIDNSMVLSPSGRYNVQDVHSPSKGGMAEDAVNGTNGGVHGDDDEDHDDEGTPNRSLRIRNSINYNLKDLSRKAQGKEAKNRKRKALHDVAEGHVVWDVPAQTVQLGSYRCVTCGNTHDTLARLQTHLKLQHPEFEFVTSISGKGAHIQVMHRYDYHGQEDGRYQLQSPSKPFDAEQFANGDGSYIQLRTSEFEPPEEGARKKGRRRNAAARSPSKGPEPKRKPAAEKLLVPFTKQTLYDPVSRLPLVPGSEYHWPKADDWWLMQWHREAIEDFSDIPPEEREFMTTWDQFMLSQRISSEAYLPSSWLEFVKTKADWLVASDSRMVEFGKHLTYLLTRHVLNDATIQEAFRSITAAKDRFRQSGGIRISGPPKQSPKKKNATNCQVCWRPVFGPRQVFCANPNCRARSYHADCVGLDVDINERDPNWLCGSCSHIPKTQRV